MKKKSLRSYGWKTRRHGNDGDNLKGGKHVCGGIKRDALYSFKKTMYSFNYNVGSSVFDIFYWMAETRLSGMCICGYCLLNRAMLSKYAIT